MKMLRCSAVDTRVNKIAAKQSYQTQNDPITPELLADTIKHFITECNFPQDELIWFTFRIQVGDPT